MGEIRFNGITLSEVNGYPDSEEKRNLLLKIDALPKEFQPSESYGDNGYRLSDEMMNSLGGNVILLPLEYISNYVGLEFKQMLDSGDEEAIDTVKGFLKNTDLFYYFQQMKPYILGLLAYSVVSKPDNKELVYCALKVLNMYHDWYFLCMGNDREGISKMVEEHKKWQSSLN